SSSKMRDGASSDSSDSSETVGGASNTSGARDAGGSSGGTCAGVSHTNGLGQTWQDCVALGTYNHEQALNAGRASFGDSCAPTDPQFSCQGIAGIGAAIVPNLVNLWIYSASASAGTRAGYVLQYAPSTFHCPNWPSPIGAWE